MGQFANGLRILIALVRFETILFFLANGIADPTTSYSTGDNTNSTSNLTTTTPSHGIDPLFFGNTTNCDKPGEPKHYTHVANLEFYLAVCMLGLMAAIQLIKQWVDAAEEADKLEIAAATKVTARAADIAQAKFIAAKEAAETAVDEANAAYEEASDAARGQRIKEKEDFASKLKRIRDVAQNFYSAALDEEIAAGVPKGMARLANTERKVLRFSVFLLNLLSIWCSILGVWTFTDVLDYKLGCKKAFHSSPFMRPSLAILTIIMGLLYSRLIYIAATKN